MDRSLPRTPSRGSRLLIGSLCIPTAMVVAVTTAILLASSRPTYAQSSSAVQDDGRAGEVSGRADDSRLRVGIREAPPFAIREPDGSWSGIAVELWKAVATDLGRSFQLEERELEELFSGLASGELQVAIGALTVTRGRETRADFTHPFYSSGLGIAVRTQGGNPLAGVVARVFSTAFLQALAALVFVLLFTGLLMWVVERKRNPEEFGGSALRGIAEGFWWSAVTMTTVGYGDRTPRSGIGRLIALVWMFASVITISGFTAAIASTLTIGSLESGVQGPQDLGSVRVGGVSNTTGASYLESRDLRVLEYENTRAALEALSGGEVEAVVQDEPILRYWARRDFESKVQLLASTFEPQQYAIALRNESELREAATRAVLATLESPLWQRILRSYLGGD